MGLEKLAEHDSRFDAAEDYLEVLYKLWEWSWDVGAVKCDRQASVFADPSGVHAVRHESPFNRSNSTYLCKPLPRRVPLLFQAGASDRGQDFAARHAKCIFTSAPTPAAARPLTEALRKKAVAQGRGPDALRMLNLVNVVVGRAAAKRRTSWRIIPVPKRLRRIIRHRSGKICRASRLTSRSSRAPPMSISPTWQR
jgi:alkanesulfonate monooxygenase SsuD/methylene tetrahydromethanopterin reductase-like flavin-dependent oxidoreductase (luciferase family)